MKITRLISLGAFAVLATLAWTMSWGPIADPPLIIPLVFAAAALAMPAIWQLTRLLLDFAAEQCGPFHWPDGRAPQTGTPPATAFA